MATTSRKYDTRKALTDYYVYAPLGAGQLLIEKTRKLSGKAWQLWQSGVDAVSATYREMAERGEKLAAGIRRSAYTQRAVDQTSTASRQVKAAATSVRKAVGTTAQATRAAAKKVG
jgi:hypothetical protein